ncbi:pyruvate, water dikinase [Paenibacillus sp. 1_12]|uniref:phosphoenolpyruvate synthase n=1 Tax=Paenibacillus sp. 1_12 TaxID=1566278 RepID=UPI0008EAB7C0|nr:phosphoenolpyruvate synthase [Paenibacillus sp. 1_12]SFL48894.1 pyruvate, water dikinase [Paenibacillus sp. 1_12]
MKGYVLDFTQIDKSSLPIVGGKGANLGEMTRAGFPVPPGFCVTTAAYREFIRQSDQMAAYFHQLDGIEADHLGAITELGQKIRNHLVTVSIPEAIVVEILNSWEQSGKDHAYAVRSSATAEDLPTASFAGQQDTYLNVKGREQLLQAIRQCWASLFTDRAISYRAKNRFDHRTVLLSVVVQQMVFPEVSGIMFTADPISGHRGTLSIDASFGLGEALVSGLVSADLYQVRAGTIISKKIAKKKLAIFSLPEGGTVTKDLPDDMQNRQALEDSKIKQLASLGESVKAHYGADQDMEWCLAEGTLFLVQSRPITSLYPLPQVLTDQGESPHILLSFGHQQMMPDAMKPMALSIWQTMFPFGKPAVQVESRFTYRAGGRMFIDITPILTLKPARNIVPKVLKGVDEMIGIGVGDFVQRDAFVQGLKQPKGLPMQVARFVAPLFGRVVNNLVFADTSQAIHTVNRWLRSSFQSSKDQLPDVSGTTRVIWVQEHAGKLLRSLFQQLMAYPLSGVIASKLIQELAIRWLNDKEVIHTLNKSLTGNVTSEMGLMIGDLADLARPYPEVIRLIHEGNVSSFREDLLTVEGGSHFLAGWDRFIQLYGMRCAGEIDITRPRWGEDASSLLPSIESHMRAMKPKEHRERFAQGALEAQAAADDLLERIGRQSFGWFKKRLMRRLMRVFRDLMCLREHPKYLMMQHFGLFRESILKEAQSLKQTGVLLEREDVFYLSLDELLQLTEGRPIEHLSQIIDSRKQEYEYFRSLTPPRLMTSEGEIITGSRSQKAAPEHALVGTPVSAGVVEGIARVVLRPEEAKLNKGEILIAPYTDPGWTPLFHSCVGLVMEVGGLMTHGAVVAREYGLPAVVGIDDATKLIHDGDLIRLDGTHGYVVVLNSSFKS